MSEKNRYLAQEAAAIAAPITFASQTGAANTAAASAITVANVQLVIDMVALEGADIGVNRGWLDEMSPSARVFLYKILLGLKASAT